jgi:hypothetical protein
VGNIRLLPRLPRRLRARIGIGAPEHNVSHALSKADSNVGQSSLSASVFDGIVQQGCDNFLFVATVFEDQSCHGEQMRNIRDQSPLAHLT